VLDLITFKQLDLKQNVDHEHRNDEEALIDL